MAEQTPDADLQAQLRELAAERVRKRVAAAAKARQAAADARAAQGGRRKFGVNRRNAAREARIRLTQQHDRKDDKP